MARTSTFLILWGWLVLGCLGGIAPTGERQGVDSPPAGDFLSMSDEMKRFLDEHVAVQRGQSKRLQILLEAIFDRSRLDFEYSNRRTHTAGQTFRRRSGNCLSFTAMFIVMARYVGLNARFQEVYDHSTWTKRGNLVLFNRHMDALVEVDGKRVEVDFDFSTDKKLRTARVVSDRRARAHYYNNIGAEALMAGDYELAESRFKEAIRQDEGFSPGWTNLGLLYRHTRKPGRAERSFKRAISLDPKDVSGRVNLWQLYKEQGHTQKAARMWKGIKKARRQNPFYHYSRGQEAFEAQKFGEAVEHYKRAIRRNSREPEFYVRLAAAYYRLGNPKSAEKYLKKAAKWARTTQERSRYRQKLEYLYSHR